MDNKFDDILDKDEKILKVFKPNKKKLYWSVALTYFIITSLILLPILISVVSISSRNNYMHGVTPLTIVLLIMLLLYIFILTLTKVYYNKLFYAYSNKRIIIRTGIIGVDYKSLDLAMVGAVNVSVSFLDKLVSKNTGTITFGSMASPIVSPTSQGGVNPYRFANIVEPYKLYKDLKTVIDEYKESKNTK